MLRRFLAFIFCFILLLCIGGDCDNGILISLIGILWGASGEMEQSPARALSMVDPSEEIVVKAIANEFRDREDDVKEVIIRTSDAPVDEFIGVTLPKIEREESHVDFLIIQAKEIDPLINAGKIQPYPNKVDETDFMSAAIRAMTRDDELYGIPIFMDKDGQLRGVVVSSELGRDQSEVGDKLTLDFSDFLTLRENAAKFVEALDGTSVRARVEIAEVNFDAPGNDWDNLNGEWVIIINKWSTDVDMTGYTLSDDSGHVYKFGNFVLPEGDHVTVYTGAGFDTVESLYWGSDAPIWTNEGDIARLEDPEGVFVDKYEW